MSCVEEKDVEIDAQDLFPQIRNNIERPFGGMNFEDMFKCILMLVVLGQLEPLVHLVSAIKEVMKDIKTELAQEIDKRMHTFSQQAIVNAIEWARLMLWSSC
jgi:hypothetical protein